MTDPQIWTLIAVMSALFFAVLRTNQSVVKAVDERIGARIDALEAKLDTQVARLDAKIDDRFDRLTAVMDARFADVDHRLTTVEGDLALVKGHLIGQRSA